MLTPFMKELTELLGKHGYEPETIQTVTVDGPTHHMDIVRYVVKERTEGGYRKMIDPHNGQPILTRETYPLNAPDPDFDGEALTAENLMALPVGTVIVDRRGDRFTRRSDGRYTDMEDDPTDTIIDMVKYVAACSPVRLLKRGGES